MKKFFYLCLLAFLSNNMEAQIINKLSVELNAGRFAKETRLFNADYYTNEFSYVNGFNIGYQATEKWQYYIGFRNLNNNANIAGGLSAQYYGVQGIEGKVGATYSPRPHRRVFLSFGIEAFSEIARLKGTYHTDAPPHAFEINHKKYYIGIAPVLTLNVRVAEKIVLFADTRYRFGYVNLTRQESTRPYYPLFAESNYFMQVFDPLNAVGVRFHL